MIQKRWKSEHVQKKLVRQVTNMAAADTKALARRGRERT